MAIGKPLLVTERKGVSQPVLSAQTQALSTNVAAQKITMADYSIGMNNAQASVAVTSELVGMVEASVNAAVLIDKNQKDYKRLGMTEDWQQSNLDYQTRFANATSPEEKAGLISDYQSSTSKFTENWREVQGKTLESEKHLSGLRYNSNKLHSAMSTTYNQDIHTRTGLMYNNSIATVLILLQIWLLALIILRVILKI
mgnify:FL=1